MTQYTPYNEPQFRDGSGAITQPLNNRTTKLSTTEFVLNQLIDMSNAQNIIVRQDANALLNEFSSLASAVNSITDSSPSKPYIIKVYAGVYHEPVIDMSAKTNISIIGSSIDTVEINPVGNNDLFLMGKNCELSFLNIKNVPVNKVAVTVNDIGDFAQLHKISMHNNHTNILVRSVTKDTFLYMEYVDLNGEYLNGIVCEATNNFTARVNAENFYCFPSSLVQNNVYSTGVKSQIDVLTSGIIGYGSDTGVFSNNSGLIRVIGSYIEGCLIGAKTQNSGTLRVFNTTLDNIDRNVYVPNIGSNPFLELLGIDCGNTAVTDIEIANPNCFGIVNGYFNTSKFINVSDNLAVNYTDGINKNFNVLGDLRLGRTSNTLVDVTCLNLIQGMGLVTGGEISIQSGLTISVNSGFGYVLISDYPNKEIRKIFFNPSNLLLANNSELYIYVNNNGVLSSTTTKPNIKNVVYLGTVITKDNSIIAIDQTPMVINHLTNELSLWVKEVFGFQYISGSIVTENAIPFHLDITNGVYRLAENKISTVGGANKSFDIFYRNGSTYNILANQNTVPFSYDNNSGTLQPLSNNHYVNHVLYTVGQGVYEKYFLLIGQNQFNSLGDAQNAPLPIPPSFFNGSCLTIAKIIVANGNSNISEIKDLRPRPLSATSVSSGVTDHNQLTGRDLPSGHTWALDVNGSNKMLANFDMNNFEIVNSGLINGVNIQSHASRHQHNGQDEIATATPVGSGIPKALPTGLLDIGWIPSTQTPTGNSIPKSLSNGLLDIGWIPIIPISKGGHGQTTKELGFNALSPLTTKGDIIVFNGANNVRRSVDPIDGMALASDSTNPTGLDYHPIGYLYNPKYECLLEDDFVSSVTASRLGWQATPSGLGSVVSIDGTFTNQNHFGMVLMGTGTTTTGRVILITNNQAIQLGGGVTKCSGVIYLPLLSTPTERFNLRLLLGDNAASGDFTDGVYFEYDESISPNWRINTASGAVRTKVTTTVPVATGFTNLSFTINSAGTRVEFFVNGVSVGVITTNIPTTPSTTLSPIFKIEKTAGFTNRQLIVDYFYFNTVFNTAR